MLKKKKCEQPEQQQKLKSSNNKNSGKILQLESHKYLRLLKSLVSTE